MAAGYTSLRTRALAVLTAVVLVLVGGVSLLTLTIVRQGFLKLEEESVQRDVERARGLLNQSLQGLTSVALDYASSPEPLRFFKTGDVNTLRQASTSENYERFQVDLVAFLDAQGRPLERRTYHTAGPLSLRAEDPPETVLPPSLARLVESESRLLDRSNRPRETHGLVVLPEAVILYVAAPAIAPEGERVAGYVIFARALTAQRLSAMASLLATTLELRPVTADTLPADFRGALRAMGDHPSAVRILSADRVAGYTLLQDITGRQRMLLRVDTDRDIYRRGTVLIYGLISAVAIAGLVLGAAGFFIVNQWVVERVAQLNAQVGDLTRSKDLERRLELSGRDELTELAGGFNDLLEALEKMTGELGTEIRERIKVQEKLYKANRELEATLQFRQDLSNMLVHDIRSPLTVIDFYLQIQAKKTGGRPLDSSLALAMKSVNRLNLMINDLLIMAKFEAGKVVLNKSVFDFRSLISKNIDEVRFLAEKRGVAIREELPVEPIEVELDANLLWRVVENLLSNAVKYSPEGAAVIVKLDRQSLSNFFHRRPSEMLLSVVDSGPGIPTELHEAIFEKFNIGKLDKSKLQIGLGLSFCRMIVEAQGGRIWVENNVPQGSIFRVSLPLATRTDRPVATSVRPAAGDGGEACSPAPVP